MIDGLIGKKLGMTQVFREDGRSVPVTVIQAGPCVVVDKRVPGVGKVNYSALQLGLVEPGRKVRANKPMTGHFKRAKVPPTAVLREFDFSEDEENGIAVGDKVLVGDVFNVADLVDVSGVTKGRGFQGVIKRHGFSGGGASHGSMFHRAPGSIGAAAYPARVMKGMKGPGRMGNKNVKIRRLEVVDIDGENNLILVKGSVPGSCGGYVAITRSKR